MVRQVMPVQGDSISNDVFQDLPKRQDVRKKEKFTSSMCDFSTVCRKAIIDVSKVLQLLLLILPCYVL
jgi:hypothetical protein